MKRVLSALLAFTLIFSISACGNSTADDSVPVESIQTEDIVSVGSESEPEKTEESKQEENIPSDNGGESDGGILIVYFSRWGNTEYPDGIDGVGD